MAEKAVDTGSRHLCLAIALAAILTAAFKTTVALAEFAKDNEFASHIVLVPVISVGLLLRHRTRVFRKAERGPWWPAAAGGLGFATTRFAEGSLATQDILAMRAFFLVVIVIGIFLLLYGRASFRAALFPLLFLFLAVPLPQALLNATVRLLQHGSAAFTDILFRLAGVAFYREGTMFALAGVGIDIGAECSGIRSSIALVMAMLLAGHMLLKSHWSKAILVLTAVPVALLKNAIRIATLSLLALHSDVRWLTDSRLHREGGILFFGLAIVLLLPVLRGLMMLEGRRLRSEADPRP